MLTDVELANEINGVLLQVSDRLNSSIATVMDRSSESEFRAYRRAVAVVMAELLEILNQLYEQHPEIRPDGIKATEGI